MNHPTVVEHLSDRFQAAGVDRVFAVHHDCVLGFCRKLAASHIRRTGTTREDTAAFAADGYARRRGIGTLAVT